MSAVAENQQTAAPEVLVTADQDVCVGSGMCKLTAPGVFDQDMRGMVDVVDPAPGGEDLKAAITAGLTCPSGAISVKR